MSGTLSPSGDGAGASSVPACSPVCRSPLPGPAQPASVAAAASLSKCHNSTEGEKNDEKKQKRGLCASQAKTAFALRLNCASLVESSGLNSCGFLTLTVGDYHCLVHGKQLPKGRKKNSCPVCSRKMEFVQVFDSNEANRRVNSLRHHVLSPLFSRAVIVSERHKSTAIHFHLLGALASRLDIRTGFDFREVRNGNYRSVCAELRNIWALLREKLPLYGFGRAEFTPIRKTAGAVASYVSKYIEKNVRHRLPEDKGKKLVRYYGFNRQQLKANEFDWMTDASVAWRARARATLDLVRVPLPDATVCPAPHVLAAITAAQGQIRAKCLDGSSARQVIGPKWAFYVSMLHEKLQVPATAKLELDYFQRDLLSGELQRLAGRQWCKHVENPPPELCGEVWSRRALNEYFSTFPKSGATVLPSATVRPASGLDFRASGS